ncbi:PAS domain S-box protein [Leptolyngbya sp. FACHB-261]|uniref:PAS domain S-box protein n=1 Tax=Leptolyngbya sp. FACHB-261 TaxID=2692806 RepID=UPI0016895AC1|nr:PAS domain S-box protein [Leptolyngbya sp. FACHB-261]MBD2103724.1 PAS domain S-box protein [Leptolyngbya sp. FACHB-261]
MSGQPPAQKSWLHDEAALSNVFEHISDGIFIVDVETIQDESGAEVIAFRYVGCNPADERMTGLSNQAIAGFRPHECLPPEIADRVCANYRRCLEHAEPISYEESFDRPPNWLARPDAQPIAGSSVGEGSVTEPPRQLLTTLSAVRDANGRVWRIIGSGQDITERKRAEAALRQSEELFRSLSACSPVGIFLADTEGRCLYTNPQCQAICGLTLEESLGEGWAKAVHPEDREWVFAEWSLAARAGQKCFQEYRFLRQDGSICWVRVRTSPRLSDQGELMGHVGTIEDITVSKQLEAERQQAEAILQQSEARYRAIVEDQIELLCRFLPDGTLTFANDSFCRYYGRNQKELIGNPFWASNPNIDRDQVAQHIASLSAENPVASIEEYFINQSGQLRYQLWTDRAIFDEQGRLVEIQAIGQDITERKQAEEALRRSEAYYRAIVEDQTELISRSRPDGTLTFVNEAYCRHVNQPRETLIGQNYKPFVLEQDRAQLEQHLATLNRDNPVAIIEHREVAGNGEIRWMQWIDRAILDEQGQLIEVQSVGHDITERKRTAEREQLLSTIALRIRQSLDLNEILNATVTGVRQLIQADRVVIYRFQPDWTGVVVVESVGIGWTPMVGMKITNPLGESYIQSLSQGQVIAIEDIHVAEIDQYHLDLVAQFQVRGDLVVPIPQDHQLWGLLIVHQCSGPRSWQSFEIDLLKQLSTQVSIAIQQAQLYEQTQLQAQQEQALNRITQTIRNSLDLDTIFSTAVAEIRQLLKADRMVLFRFSIETSLVLAQSVGPGLNLIGEISTELHEAWAKQRLTHFQQGNISVMPDFQQLSFPAKVDEFIQQYQVKSSLAVPVIQGAHFLGVLTAHQCSGSRYWQPFEIELLERLADQLAIAIQQAELYKQTQHQAQRAQALNRVTQVIRSSLDLNTIFTTAVEEIGKLLQVDRSGIFQYVSERQVWLRVADYRQRDDLPVTLGLEIPSTNNLVSLRLKQLEIVQIDDTTNTEQGEVNQNLAQAFPGAWLLVPLHFQRSLWGCLSLSMVNSSHSWQNSEVDLACAVADQLSMAIQQAQLYQQVQALNSQLEHQVQERTAQLQQALEFEAVLKRVTDKVRDSLDEQQILRTAVRELVLALNVDYCNTAAYVINSDTGKLDHLVIEHEYGLKDWPSLQDQVFEVAELSEIYDYLFQGKYLQFCELFPLPGRPRAVTLACPIFDEQGVIGGLWLFKQSESAFDEMEVRLTQQVVNQCAIAIRQARLYQASQSQVVALEHLNRLKDDFLSTVSHELRTPLSNMRMAIHMLKTTAGAKNGERYLEILQTECAREIELINDLLDLQRLETGLAPIEAESLQLQDWIPDLIEPFQSRILERQQTFRVELASDLPPLISGRKELSRILSELLNNACKYTRPNGTITLKAQAIVGPVPMIAIAVCNSEELPQAELTRVFDKFYRIPNADPWRQGGTGLGLALVQKLAEHLQGKISVQSQAKQTVFTVLLPQTPVSRSL